MKLGIVGFHQSGKSTIFEALTGARGEGQAQKASHSDQRIGTVRVSDERVDLLTGLYQPKKTTYARVEYVLPSAIPDGNQSRPESMILNQVRACDALIHVIRNFQAPGAASPTAEGDFWQMEEEMILNDLVVVEKRIERIEIDAKRGNKADQSEVTLLRSCQKILENNQPLRSDQTLAAAPALRGFTFLTSKPQLIIINNDDEDLSTPVWERLPEGLEMLVVRGRLEMEIASMSQEEAKEFLLAYHIERTALDRVIKTSYHILNLVSFFTVLNQEVRAWAITEGTPAVEAAGSVHSDMQRGFIRAEVLSCQDLKDLGTFQEAKKAGQVRLEGKDYRVRDGDIINFRFNV